MVGTASDRLGSGTTTCDLPSSTVFLLRERDSFAPVLAKLGYVLGIAVLVVAALCRWVRIYYIWRPNLSDEADNHVVELAVAGSATDIVTQNLRDFSNTQLHFPGIRIIHPRDLVQEIAP